MDISAASSEASTDVDADSAPPTPALANVSLNGSPPSLEPRKGNLVHIECAQALTLNPEKEKVRIRSVEWCFARGRMNG